ncbi:hypothetical protein Tco_0406749, partial [Tanacetum coccineum]
MGAADVNKTTWNNLVPRKVNVFVWRALNGRLVRVELDKKSKRSGGLLAWCQAMAPVLAMAHHSMVRAKASRL